MKTITSADLVSHPADPIILVAPAAHAIARIQAVHAAQPLAPIWVILPNQAQVTAFRRRLARVRELTEPPAEGETAPPPSAGAAETMIAAVQELSHLARSETGQSRLGRRPAREAGGGARVVRVKIEPGWRGR
jgi:hypothetical protein